MLPNPYAILAAIGFWVLSSVAVYTYATNHTDTKWEAKTLAAENAALRKGQAMQRAADQVAIDIAGSQAIVQEKIVTQTKVITQRIPYYVSDASGCITVGLVRVLDAAAIGADPADLDLAPNEHNDTCSGFSSAALAESVAENYGRSQQNSAQLTDAQEYIRRVESALMTSGSNK